MGLKKWAGVVEDLVDIARVSSLFLLSLKPTEAALFNRNIMQAVYEILNALVATFKKYKEIDKLDLITLFYRI